MENPPESHPVTLSIVIRSWNEAVELERLLKNLTAQRYPKDLVELIVVDNGSTDATAEVITRYGAKQVYLSQEAFTYPKSLNLGIEAAQGEVILLISAHGLPMNTEWFKIAASYFGIEGDPKLAGIYGTNAPGPNASVWENLLMWPDYWRRKLRGKFSVHKAIPGIFNATNCAFPKKLWEERPFNEEWAAGGEDYEWAAWAIQAGYYFMLDPKFTVYHSHGLGLLQLFKQQRYWKSLGVLAFDHAKLAYRKDLAERIRSLQ